MHKTLAEARALARDIVQGVDPPRAGGPRWSWRRPIRPWPRWPPNCRVRVLLAAQDTFWEEKGAYTGAIAAGMLADAGCRYVIVGHSERRQHFGDTDDSVNRKVKAVVAAAGSPILCVGETLAEREADNP
jgi:hypothetical protein